MRRRRRARWTPVPLWGNSRGRRDQLSCIRRPHSAGTSRTCATAPLVPTVRTDGGVHRHVPGVFPADAPAPLTRASAHTWRSTPDRALECARRPIGRTPRCIVSSDVWVERTASAVVLLHIGLALASAVFVAALAPVNLSSKLAAGSEWRRAPVLCASCRLPLTSAGSRRGCREFMQRMAVDSVGLCLNKPRGRRGHGGSRAAGVPDAPRPRQLWRRRHALAYCHCDRERARARRTRRSGAGCASAWAGGPGRGGG